MCMTTCIMKRYLRLPTIHEIYSALSKVFYDGSNELRIFTLNQTTFIAKQSRKFQSEYYRELIEVFSELNHCDTVVMKNFEDIATYPKFIERLRVHTFLVELDDEFEQVNGEILDLEE